jgi:hypothetical protein
MRSVAGLHVGGAQVGRVVGGVIHISMPRCSLFVVACEDVSARAPVCQFPAT